MNILSVFVLLSLPAFFALSFDDGSLAWYISDALLVSSLCILLAKGKNIQLKLVFYFCAFYHILAASYGVASDTGAVSKFGLLVLLITTIFVLEFICKKS